MSTAEIWGWPSCVGVQRICTRNSPILFTGANTCFSVRNEWHATFSNACEQCCVNPIHMHWMWICTGLDLETTPKSVSYPYSAASPSLCTGGSGSAWFCSPIHRMELCLVNNEGAWWSGSCRHPAITVTLLDATYVLRGTEGFSVTTTILLVSSREHWLLFFAAFFFFLSV